MARKWLQGLQLSEVDKEVLQAMLVRGYAAGIGSDPTSEEFPAVCSKDAGADLRILCLFSSEWRGGGYWWVKSMKCSRADLCFAWSLTEIRTSCGESFCCCIQPDTLWKRVIPSELDQLITWHFISGNVRVASLLKNQGLLPQTDTWKQCSARRVPHQAQLVIPDENVKDGLLAP